MRITEAASRLGTSPRMLRYREALGLLPATKEGAGHRHFSPAELEAAALALALEKRFDVSPAALAFALRALADPEVRVALYTLGERTGRLTSSPARVLDFEKEKALRLLPTMGRVGPRRPASAPIRRRAPVTSQSWRR